MLNVILLSIFLLSCKTFSANSFECLLDFKDSKELVLETLQERCTEPFYVDDIQMVNQKVRISKQEILYLSDIKLKSMVNSQQLQHLVAYLYETGQIRSVTLRLIDAVLTIELDEVWILSDVRFKGIPFGSAHYLQYYEMQAGDPFEKEKHEQSIEKLTEIFQKKGYKSVAIIADIVEKSRRKHYKIVIKITKGNRFVIHETQVKVRGIQTLQMNQLQKILAKKLYKGLQRKPYDTQLIDQQTKLMQEYLTEQGYVDAKIRLYETLDEDNHKVALEFVITFSKNREITILGNSFFSHKEIMTMINRFGDALGMLPVSLIAQDIKNQYHKKGFWNVVIQSEESEDGKLYFIINEEQRTCIDKVEYKDMRAFDAKKIERLFFTRFSKQHFFDSSYVKQATENLLDYYAQHGFWDAAIVKKNYESLNDQNHYKLILTIDEGQQRLLKAVVIEKFPELLQKGPFLKLQKLMKKPLVFDKRLIKEQHDWLITYLKKQGYLSVKVEPLLHAEGSEVVLTWSIKADQLITCGKVLLKGASKVGHTLIKNIVDMKDEKIWSKDRLQLGYTRLKKLDIFKQIQMYPMQGVDAHHRDMIVYLQDDDPFEIRTRFGFQQVSENFALKKGSTYKIGGSALWRNPTAKADMLRFDADLTRFERRTDLFYRRPLQLHIPVIATLKIYANNYTQPLSAGSRKTLYKVTQEGCLINIASQTRHSNTSFTCGAEWMETKDISEKFAQAINFKTDLISKKVPYFFIEPSIFIDFLDDKLNPTQGLFIAGSIKGMFPLSSSSYFIKLLIEQGIFFPLLKDSKIVCGARVKFGHIFKETFSKIMPPERFYLGGANSLRGYLPDSCPPLGTIIEADGKMQRVPQGGKSMVNMNFELRIPTFSMIDMVIFQDFGVLVEDITNLSYGKNSLAATGLGLRYQTSIGPIRFDIGWKWQKPFPEDTAYAWFLTFGHSF
jgi:translocation and assembly module TamA